MMKTFQTISNCGLYCNECNFYISEQCKGCYIVKGTPFWTHDLPDKICPLFQCAVYQRNYHNCGDCNELPCETFIQLKDPNITEKEHKKLLKLRCERLKTIRSYK